MDRFHASNQRQNGSVLTWPLAPPSPFPHAGIALGWDGSGCGCIGASLASGPPWQPQSKDEEEEDEEEEEAPTRAREIRNSRTARKKERKGGGKGKKNESRNPYGSRERGRGRIHDWLAGGVPTSLPSLPPSCLLMHYAADQRHRRSISEMQWGSWDETNNFQVNGNGSSSSSSSSRRGKKLDGSPAARRLSGNVDGNERSRNAMARGWRLSSCDHDPPGGADDGHGD